MEFVDSMQQDDLEKITNSLIKESIDTGFGPDCLKTVLSANEGLDFREFFEKIGK